MSRLRGKTAVITGANSGIGLVTAKTFIDEGAEKARNASTSLDIERPNSMRRRAWIVVTLADVATGWLNCGVPPVYQTYSSIECPKSLAN